jgi:hypothetical protein
VSRGLIKDQEPMLAGPSHAPDVAPAEG